MTWNVLRVRSGREAVVAAGVVELGYRSFCPLYRSSWVVRERRVGRLVPLWATYCLADWPAGDGAAWHRVMDLEWVSGVIGGEEPVAVQESAIEEWVQQADEGGVVTSLDVLIDRLRRGFGRGDRVKIEGGAFGGASGVCNWIDGAGVNVKTALLGREVNIYVPNLQARIVRDDMDVTAVSRSRSRRQRRRLLADARGALAPSLQS